MELDKVPLLMENIDIDHYKAADRKIRHIFPGASAELVAMAINFAHSGDLAVPGGHDRKGWDRRKAALDRLLGDGYIVPLYGHWHDVTGGKGKCSTYRRTALFEKTFRFRVPDRLAVSETVLSSAYEEEPDAHNRKKVNLIPALSTYSKLAEGVTLSLSTGRQVFRKVALYRKDGKRLYAYGPYNYQSGIPKGERRNLLINGEPVVELDFSAMHPNLLLNRAGEPCRSDFYESVLRELGLPPDKEKRDAIKQMVNASFNVNSVRGYPGAVNRAIDEHSGKRIIDVLGAGPKQVYQAILRAYPKVEPYVCTGKHWEWLQATDSEIMIDVLETLAKINIVGLPLHDSVMIPAKYTDRVRQVMSDCYRRKMGFEPHLN